MPNDINEKFVPKDYATQEQIFAIILLDIFHKLESGELNSSEEAWTELNRRVKPNKLLRIQNGTK